MVAVSADGVHADESGVVVELHSLELHLAAVEEEAAMASKIAVRMIR